MNLANKYRPKTWDDVTEQSIVVDMLRTLCNQPMMNNRNFLLIGSAGVGKTSLARIMAQEINHGKGTPIEIDAASYNSADSARELVQQAQQYPIDATYKVFVIDEVHVLSSQAWQVWLKCLEDSPARSIFIFCTTNPEKIPATILSRVQTFQLSKLSLDGITKRLTYVLDSEIREGRSIKYETDAVSLIAKLANGGMRDALTLLDRALTYSSDISTVNLMQALNLPNYDDYFAYLQAYARKDNITITTITNNVYNSGVNFVKWFEGFHAFVMNIIKYIFIQDINATTIPTIYADKISKYGVNHSIICLRLANQLISLIHELKSTQYLQEVALTYMCIMPTKETNK